MSMEQLMQRHNLTERMLQRQCSEKHIMKIAHFISWREVGRFLPDIRRADLKDIDHSYRTEQDKRCRLIESFQVRNGDAATYDALIKAMLKARKLDEAEKVCELLSSGVPPKPPVTPPPVTPPPEPPATPPPGTPPPVTVTQPPNGDESPHSFPHRPIGNTLEDMMREIGEEAEKLYKEAMMQGVVKVALAILIFMGVTGSGKSLFKNLVLGLPPPDPESTKPNPSTDIIQSSGRPISISQIGVSGVPPPDPESTNPNPSTEDAEEWKELSHEKMMTRIATGIKKKTIPVSDQNIDDDTNTTIPPTPASVPESVSNDSQPQQVPSEGILFQDALNEIEIDGDICERISSPSDSSEDMNLVDFLYILDSGGQPPFRDMLPHLIQKSDMHSTGIVLMQKLNERLDFRPTIKYREEGVEDEEGYQSQPTNKEILKQYVQAVQSHNSTLFVVGTHKDQELEEEPRAVKNRKLMEAFSLIKDSNISCYKPDELMYPVDSTKRTKEEKAVAKAFRKAVRKNCLHNRVDIPLPWFVLAQLLKLLAEKMNVQVLSIKECYNAANSKLFMTEKSCDSAIKLLGKLNIIFYRHDILPNVVVCNPQVVLNKITELVRCNHRMQCSKNSQKISQGTKIPKGMMSARGVKFRDYAEINEELLKEFPLHYRPGVFEVPDFLKLLKAMKIASKLKNGNYFIPSVLSTVSDDQLETTRPEPITIYYPDMWLPVGVVPSLVTHLQDNCNWLPLMHAGEPVCMYRNYMQFELPGGMPGSVTLIDSIQFLEINIIASFTVAKHVCYDISEMIEYALKAAHKSLHYGPPTAKVGVFCSECTNSEPHHAKLNEAKTSWSCSKQSAPTEHMHVLTKGQEIWFKQDCPIQLADRPGIAILVTCDYKTPCNQDPLPGTNVDLKIMKDTLNHFNYDIHELTPDQQTQQTCPSLKPTKVQIKSRIDRIAAYLSKYGGPMKNKVIIFVFSGHGCNDDGKEMIIANDGEKLEFDKDILLPLTRHKAVEEIPKLFFIDACRGTEELKARKMGSGEGDSVKRTQHAEGNYRIEYSTIPNHVAWSNKDRGSRLLRKLGPKLKEEIRDSFQNIAANVKKIVHDNLGDDKQQCESVCHLNTGPLYLHGNGCKCPRLFEAMGGRPTHIIREFLWE